MLRFFFEPGTKIQIFFFATLEILTGRDLSPVSKCGFFCTYGELLDKGTNFTD